MERNQHRTWAEINLCAIEHNYEVIRSHAKAPVLCVVKANAYGHGAVQVATRLQTMGAPYFAVATVAEALELRQNGIDKPILILGYVDQSDMKTIVEHDITSTVYDRETGHMLAQVAEKEGKIAKIHFKLDTGMTRIGFDCWNMEKTIQEMLAISKLPCLYAEGIFTHFAVSDTVDGRAYTQLQYERFCKVCDGLNALGVKLPLRHCANSGAIQQYREMHCTMVRAGIILYGYRPDSMLDTVLDLHPAMTVKARVVQVRDIPAHTPIGYGRTFETMQRERVAVITMGYADGYLRTGSGQAKVVFGGKVTPVLGRICMDMCMARIPDDVIVKQGDEVIIFDAQHWTADDVAKAAGTISYEVLCTIGARVPRFYLK